MTLRHEWEAIPTEDHPLVQLGRALQQADYRFTTISTPSHRRVNAREANALARDLRGVFGWSRPFADGVLDAPIMALMARAGILQSDPEGWRSALRASTLDDDLYFHSAFPTDATDAVFFGPDTYRYAQVLQAALAETPLAPLHRVVDIGCGAGPGAVTMARRLPAAQVWATDINPQAIKLTALNAHLAGVGNITPAFANLLDGFARLPQAHGTSRMRSTEYEGRDETRGLDLIAANPPFMVDADERTYCHGGGALGEGLSLAIVEASLPKLAAGGRLVLYTCVAIVNGEDAFQARATDLAAAAGCTWRYRELDPDVFGGELGGELHMAANTDRIAAVALVVTRPLQ